jgi:hypothetical protein
MERRVKLWKARKGNKWHIYSSHVDGGYALCGEVYSIEYTIMPVAEMFESPEVCKRCKAKLRWLHELVDKVPPVKHPYAYSGVPLMLKEVYED